MTKPKEMFVGIDTSKNSHQVSFLNPTEIKKDLKIGNDKEGFEKLTKGLKSYRSEGYRMKVACEPTGHYWENPGYKLKEENFELELVNPFHTNRYKEIFDNTPQKDDKKGQPNNCQLAQGG